MSIQTRHPGGGPVLATLLFLAGALQAQSRQSDFQVMKSWEGYADLKLENNGSANGFVWKATGSALVNFRFDEFDPSYNRFRGAVTASNVAFRFEYVYTTSTCKYTVTGETSGPLDPKSTSAVESELRIYLNNWALSSIRNMRRFDVTRKRECAGGFTKTETVPFSILIPSQSPSTPYPASGIILESYGKALQLGINGTGDPIPPQLSQFTWDGHWWFRPQVDELTLEITSSQYETWRPSAAPGPAPGEGIQFEAVLKKASGETAQVDVQKFVWELIETSREPGIAMNYPLNASDGEPDLRFHPLSGQVLQDAEGQKMERAVVKEVRDQAEVWPYDWGGWSTLRVTAYLSGGTKVVGKFKGSREEDVRLPKRAKDSYVADAWKKDTGASGADGDDDDRDPEGEPGCNGDGLTLYEEYRGFYGNGSHFEGQPKKKDFFVRNKIGADADYGLEVFAGQTGLEVHRELRDEEFDETARLINGNHQQGPHRVDQHGVVLVPSNTVQGGLTSADASMDGYHWRPGLVTKVEIESPGGSSYTASAQVNPSDALTLYDKTVAHELLHTVGVDHHGRGDGSARAILKMTPNDRGRAHFHIHDRDALLFDEFTKEDIAASMEKNAGAVADMDKLRAICEITFAGGDVQACVAGVIDLLYGARYLIGEKNGQHSGNEQCLMRYYFAEAYKATDGGDQLGGGEFDVYARVPPGTEPSGLELCDSPAGTGVNAPERIPQPRYYDAKTGACKKWVCVNDAIPPKRIN